MMPQTSRVQLSEFAKDSLSQLRQMTDAADFEFCSFWSTKVANKYLLVSLLVPMDIGPGNEIFAWLIREIPSRLHEWLNMIETYVAVAHVQHRYYKDI